MKNRFKSLGFTLIELLSVLIILGVISAICFPIINNQIKSAKEKAYEEQVREIIKASRLYLANNDSLLPTNSYIKVNLDTLVNEGYIEKLINPIDNSDMAGCVVARHSLEDDKYTYEYSSLCEYFDNSGANKPDLLTNMIPIKYNGTNWVYADIKEEWYDYDSKEWANAVVLNSGVSKNVGDIINESDIALWYVWIPRYKYTIFNGNNGSTQVQLINITFESSTNTTGTVKCHDAINETDSNGTKISEICTDSTQENNAIVNNTSTYTHPAFCLGTKNTDGTCNGDELTGFWFGKFEISGTETAITIKPNLNSLTNKRLSQFYTAIQGMSTIYRINNGDTHVAKNMEWGAVAYLKQSSYGLGTTEISINNYYDNETYKTGCGAEANSSASTTCNAYDTENGMKASTTGNIYGVYDMSGGANEYTMGNMVNENGEFNYGSSGFTVTTMPLAKYYDAYTYDTSNITHARGKLGDAIKETLVGFGSTNGGFYGDHSSFGGTWTGRGGSHDWGWMAGIFYVSSSSGVGLSYYSTRSVLVRGV